MNILYFHFNYIPNVAFSIYIMYTYASLYTNLESVLEESQIQVSGNSFLTVGGGGDCRRADN